MKDEHSNDIFSEAGFSKFQLFYVEAMMHDSSSPFLNRVKDIFENISKDEFFELTEKAMKSDDYELSQQFFYFLILFRDMKHIQEYINSGQFTIETLERFIIFTFGYFNLHDNTTESIIDEVLYFISREKLFELIIKSKYVQKDKLLLFLLLAKFDVPLLNKYFSQIRDIKEIINYFLKLPGEVLRGIIARNYHLFKYILLMMSESESTQDASSEFFEKYKHDIMIFSKLNDMIRKYRETTDFEKEKNIPFDKRDMSRLSLIADMAKEMPDPVKAIDYFDGEHIFVDEMEKKIVLSAVTDPMMKNIFSKYT